MEQGGSGWGTGVVITSGAYGGGPVSTTTTCPADFGPDTQANGPGLGTNFSFRFYVKNSGLEIGFIAVPLTYDNNVTVPTINGSTVTNSALNNLFDIIANLNNDVVGIGLGGAVSPNVSVHDFINNLDGTGNFQVDFTGGDATYNVQINVIDNVDNVSNDSNIVSTTVDTANPISVLSSASTQHGIKGYPPAIGKISEMSGVSWVHFTFYWDENPVKTGGYFTIRAKDTPFTILDKPIFDNVNKYFIGGGGVALFNDYSVPGATASWGFFSPAPGPVSAINTGKSFGNGSGRNGPISSSFNSGASNFIRVAIYTKAFENSGMLDTQTNGPGLGTNIFIQVFVADSAGNVSDPT